MIFDPVAARFVATGETVRQGVFARAQLRPIDVIRLEAELTLTDASYVVAANEKTLRDLCAALNVGADGETPVPESARSRVDDARAVLTESQIKRVKPMTTFRGELRVTPWMSLRVWGYKKVSEAKPPAMRLFDGPDEVHRQQIARLELRRQGHWPPAGHNSRRAGD